jgi:NADH dehydrogenase FAD-containing subunit
LVSVIKYTPATADNLLLLLAGQAPVPFHYHHRVELATLGPYHAVAEIGPVHLSGPIASLVMNLIYLWILPCRRDQARIAGDWFANLFFPPDTYRVTSESCLPRQEGESTDARDGGEAEHG